ncbi:DUF5597 domain-containing protein [Naasia lichenicola]|uniref:Glycoside hydrolase n=1 Tax=Naasia lichenicola TaxID=2565933 RepID=A0A4S4FMC5_9MICO|nr:DUF5597 domain-containing protein [Naasia lichenicola]THG31650.1 glycoside hydrolase [Naasia lichenicola]
MTELPHLERVGGHTRLMVDGSPFLAIGGELHNSSSSDAAYMQPVWDRLRGSGYNTVIASVGWDQVEPVQGQFDLTVVDDLLAGARFAGVRLVLLWFGAFKNANSSYAPSWVRADTESFPRAVLSEPRLVTPFSYEGATPRPVLSVFSAALLEADRRAYSALISHLAENDHEHTVIFVQIENEVGLLGASRDRSEPALAAWNSAVPERLKTALAEHPETFAPATRERLNTALDRAVTWAQAFGEGDHVADEAFMSWGFASYLGSLASAGKQLLALPAYANAWLGPQAVGDVPGMYPSGGPTAGMLGVWRTAAPDLDFLAPDIYVPGARAVMEQYATADNPLFIPEAKFIAGDAFLAVGRFGAIGYCAFGLDDGRPGNQFSQAARLIIGAATEIADGHARGSILGFALGPDDDLESAVLDGVTVTVRNGPKLLSAMLLDVGVVVPPAPDLPDETEGSAHGSTPGDGRPFGVVIGMPDGSFLVIGQGGVLDFAAEGADLEIDYVRELRLVDGRWQEGRILNGDERLTILPSDRIGAARVGLLRRSR